MVGVFRTGWKPRLAPRPATGFDRQDSPGLAPTRFAPSDHETRLASRCGCAAGASAPCDKCRQLVGALTPTLLEPPLFVRLPIGRRPVADAGRIARLPVFVLQGDDHRHERLRRRFPSLCISVSEDKPLIFDDLEIDAPVLELVSV